MLLLLACAAMPPAAHAATEIRVLETWPAGDSVTLPRNQNFYLRLAYSTDEPVHIWARPYYRGEEANAGSNPSRVYNGSGEALGWFFFMEDGERVDEIRITAGDGSTSGTQLVATYPVEVRAGERPAAAAEPAWVTELRTENERLQREAYEQRMSEPVTTGNTLLFGGFMLAVLGIGLGGIAAPVWALWRWQGLWRAAAVVPALIIGYVVLRIVIDTARDPTSHNLWPFELLQAGAISLVLIGLLLAARRLSGTRN